MPPFQQLIYFWNREGHVGVSFLPIHTDTIVNILAISYFYCDLCSMLDCFFS
jgi:hypothetical protein